MHKRFPAHKPHAAFTIVELLIVIVVIGILAAITIVAYNSLQARARASSASSALSQAKKKLELYKVDNGSYPATGNLSAAGVTGADTTYQYTSDTTDYCLTGTNGNVSYTATNTTTPTQGVCAGHTSDPTHVIADSFNRANSTSAGTTETGESWYWSGNEWAISTGTIRGAGNTDTTVEWGKLDVRATATFVTANNYQTLVIRYNPPYTNSSAYRLTSSGVDSTLARRVNGVNTTLYTVGTILPGTRFTLSAKEESGGTRVILLRNGSELFNLLDTNASRPMGTRVGFVQLYESPAQFDDFTVDTP